MPLYRALVLGENFPAALTSQEGYIGFFTTRFVEASSREEASRAALALVRGDASLKLSHQGLGMSTVVIEEIVEVPASSQRIPNSGFTFFPMETK